MYPTLNDVHGLPSDRNRMVKQWHTEPLWKKIIPLLIVYFPLCCTQNTYYITPTPDTPCPGEPCHTLSQYGQRYFQNLSSNATLVFLPGDHTLTYTISVGTVPDSPSATHAYQLDNPYPSLTLLGSPYLPGSTLPEISSKIKCTWPAGFVFSDIVELHIDALDFTSCGHNGSAALNIQSVWNARISNCTFQNNTNGLMSESSTGGAIQVQNSTLTLARNIFQQNFAYNGGVLYTSTNSTLILSENTFQNNSAYLGGVLFALHGHNTLTVSENTFQNNSATISGGALYAETNNILILSENTFQNNYAHLGGGVFFVETNNALTISENIFQDNSANVRGGILCAQDHNTLIVTESTFQNNFADSGGALYVNSNNTLTLSDNTFQNNFATISGGALYAVTNNILILSENTFQNNSAEYGGVLCAYTNNTLVLLENTFQNNSADYGGGLIVNSNNTLTLSENTFQNNSADYGGALYAETNNTLTLSDNTFQNNSATTIGGALNAKTNNSLTLSENTFQNNSADYGGALCAYSNNTLTLSGNTFQNNSGTTVGGALFTYTNNTLTLSGNKFLNNLAFFGGVLHAFTHNSFTLSENIFEANYAHQDGGVLLVHQSTMNLTNNNLTGNMAHSKGGAVFCLRNSILHMQGSHRLINNSAHYGGGIAAVESQIILAGDVSLENNKASFGGGIYVEKSNTSAGYGYFSTNSASEYGGGIYASESTLYLKECIIFDRNSALTDGGGLLLTEDSKLCLQPNTTVEFTNNYAKRRGGAIKVEDDDPLSNCAEVSCQFSIQHDCFFQIQTQRQYDSKTNLSEITELQNIRIYFANNTVHTQAGGTLYGGFVDNCGLSLINQQTQNQIQPYSCPRSGEVFNYIARSDEEHLDLSSDPLYICACENSEPHCCSPSITTSVYPGGTIHIPVTAYGQRHGTTYAEIENHTPPESQITVDNWLLNVTKSCTVLSYTVRTKAVDTTQVMTLTVKGACPSTERIVSSMPNNQIRILVSILQCPPGFQLLTWPGCDCAKRLQRFTTTCNIGTQEIERTGEFWVGYEQDNTSDGLILYPHCPFDYCTSSQKLYIAVNSSDEQCSSNRKGLLCGECSQSFSVVLGTNRCLRCSNNDLWLIVAFAFAGIALVPVLFVLRLTVAVGTINGLLFYANIFAINSAVFLRPQTTNILTVFIAWLNLDLGIETCFYDGMDTYAKAWLQFVFPLYLWVLLIAIIIISHYSIRISTLLGSSTIEVLATLILLSYTKLLRTVIVALYYAQLEYPNNLQVSVWLADANITYLSNKHIPLFLVAVVCLIFLFFPYTMLLIFGQWLRAKSEWKICSWVNDHRVLPFLEAYHAPYSEKHRYWTGLMLLVRSILLLIFAFNVSGDPNINVLCIACTSAMLHIYHILFRSGIYKTWPLTILELSFNTNLGILAIATQYTSCAGGNQNAVVFTSISVAFATFIGVVVYHLVQQIREVTQRWKKVQRQGYDAIPRTGSRMRHHSLPYNSRACPTVTYLDVKLQETANISN